MLCQKCGKEITDASNYCKFCGSKVINQKPEIPKNKKQSSNGPVCRQCGHKVGKEDEFCTNCGSTINNTKRSIRRMIATMTIDAIIVLICIRLDLPNWILIISLIVASITVIAIENIFAKGNK
jgi:uncharacterized membrane protein YvbJ